MSICFLWTLCLNLMFGRILFDLKRFTMVIFLIFLMIPSCWSPVPGFRYTLSSLHQPAVLLCINVCSGSVRWIRKLSPNVDQVVATCNRTSCSSQHGFHLSHPQYLQGNLSLSVTAADYSKRGWYTCQCDGENVCDVSLRIKPVAYENKTRPGGVFVMDLEVTERVEVLVDRSGVSVPVCSVDSRRVQCSEEYARRVELKCSLTLSDVQEADSGVYSLRDTENQENISTHTLTLAGNDTDTNCTLPPKGELNSWNMSRIFREELHGVVVGGVFGFLFVVVLWGLVRPCSRIWSRVKKWWRRDDGHNMMKSPSEKIMLNSMRQH